MLLLLFSWWPTAQASSDKQAPYKFYDRKSDDLDKGVTFRENGYRRSQLCTCNGLMTINMFTAAQKADNGQVGLNCIYLWL